MKHKSSLVLASLAMVLSCGLIGGVHSNKEVVEPVEAAEGNYYSSITDSMSGTTLLSNLKSIINTSSVSVSYDWSRYEDADEDPNNSNNVLLIYARNSVSKSAHVSGSTGWNREHTFPQSKMEVTQAKSDNHIIFASDNKVNGARSSLKMGVVSGGTVVNDYNGNATTCRKTSSLFDPNNQARGVVARTTMYAAAMYDFDPTDNFESIATMLRWHLDYPVDSFDQGRNEKVYTNQHNRNPFVDHPEYACRIWGSTNSTTQSICGSTAGITSISKTSVSLAAGGTTTISAVSSNSGTISWTSSNTSIATVSNATAASGSNVTITAVAQGSATITASITISGTTYTKTCSVTVTAAKTLSSIAVSNAKTSYVVDDTFVKPTVTATYSDGSTDDVKDSAVFSGYNLSQTGNQTVNVSYTYSGTTKTATYSITVNSSGGSGGGESGSFSGTYNYSNQGTGTGKTWSLTDCSDQKSYWLCPNTGDESIALISGIFTDLTIASNVVITINSGTYGSGSNPSSSTFTIYNSSGCTSQVSATQTGTLPTSKTYTNAIYTVSLANASSFSNDLAIKITKPGKQIRLVSITVEFDYETQGGSSSPTLSSISLDTTNVQTAFTVNATFTFTGLVVTAHYSDSTSAIVTPTSVSTPDMSTTGNKTVTVTYLTVSNTYTITVSNAAATSITATVSKTYYVGETISASDISVKDNFNNDIETFTFANDGYQFTYADAASGGALTNKTFTDAVSGSNLTCSLIVQVQRKERVTPSGADYSVSYTDLPTSYQTSKTERTAVSGVKFIAYNLANYSSKMQFKASGGYFQTTEELSLVSLTINNRETNALTVYGSTNGTSFSQTITGSNDVYDLTGYSYVKVMKNGSGAAYCASLTITVEGGDTAVNVANYVMYEDTNYQCNTKLDIAIGYLNNLTQTELNSFANKTESQDYVIYTARTRLNAWAASKGKTINYSTAGHVVVNSYANPIINAFEAVNATTIIIIIGIVGLTALGGYIFIRKRKEI